MLQDPILQYLSQGIRRKPQPQRDPYSFEGVQDMAIGKTVDLACAELMRWFYGVLSNYPENYFHTVMRMGIYQDVRGVRKQGYDLVADLSRSHGMIFNKMLSIAANGIDLVSYDINDMTARTVYVLKAYAKWQGVYPHEFVCLRDTLEKINFMIYQKKQMKMQKGIR